MIEAHRRGDERIATTLDLGLSTVELSLTADGIDMLDGSRLPWASVQQIAKKDNNCFAVENGEAEPVHRFSTAFNRGYTLRATAGAPTLLISGFPMHRIKDITPDEDTRRKIAAAGSLGGRVLDTTTGLGYTAIEASKSGASVTTIELDPLVLEVGRYNPWSQALFDGRIRQMVGNSFDVVPTLRDGEFDTILHDPPTFSLAGELYSEEFYHQAFRVLGHRGKLFHYIGDLESRSGRVVSKGVVKRLQLAGFKRVARHPEAFALVAFKS